MDIIVKQWQERAQYDLETAHGMIKIRKYLYAAFMCQQALEKLLKGLLAHQNKNIFPIHNLPRLAQEVGIFDLCEEKESGLLAELTPFCIKARYGEYKKKLSELCDQEMAKNYLQSTERLFRWLLKQFR